LWIAFRSDGSVEYSGFRATFYFIDGALRLRLDAYGTVRAVRVRFGYRYVTLRYVTWGGKQAPLRSKAVTWLITQVSK